MLEINRVHHLAIICSNYAVSRHFYTNVLGFEVISEVFRSERNSYKLDLSVAGQYQIELFSFPDPPARVSQPEACGLRHIAFAVTDIERSVSLLQQKGVATEDIRVDEYTGKRFVFFADPDGLPIELYEADD